MWRRRRRPGPRAAENLAVLLAVPDARPGAAELAAVAHRHAPAQHAQHTSSSLHCTARAAHLSTLRSPAIDSSIGMCLKMCRHIGRLGQRVGAPITNRRLLFMKVSAGRWVCAHGYYQVVCFYVLHDKGQPDVCHLRANPQFYATGSTVGPLPFTPPSFLRLGPLYETVRPRARGRCLTVVWRDTQIIYLFIYLDPDFRMHLYKWTPRGVSIYLPRTRL